MMPQWYQKMTPSQCHESWDNDYDYDYASASVKKWCLNGVIMMPQWCQISDASMVSQKWCLNGVKEVMPKWCQRSEYLNGVKTLMPWWCQRSDALMVSQHWCRDGVMHSWCCDSVMQQWRLRYPPSPDLSGARCQDGVSTPWALHEYGQAKSWLLGHVFWGLKAPRFKGNKHQKEHPKSSMVFPTLTIWHPWSTFCLIALDPI
jgi:hypothetical protein